MTAFKGPTMPLIWKIVLGFGASFLFGGTIYICVLKWQNHSPPIIWAVIMFLAGMLITQVIFSGKTWAEEFKGICDRLLRRRR